MPILNCAVKNCYYNKEKKCCLDGIRVEGSTADTVNSTACGSFREQKSETYSNAACHCGMEPETKVTVQCEAVKCMFNSDKRCSADHIGIAGDGAKHYTETECGSFKPQ